MFKIFIIIPILFTFQFVTGQGISDSSLFVPIITGNYSIQLPGGDLSERFGYNSCVGASFILKTKSNIMFGLEAGYLFGNQIKEDGILDSIRTSEGTILTKDGEAARIRLSETGYLINIKAGKFFPILGPNPNCGLFILGSAGFLQHKIRIDVERNNVPSLYGDYIKGYDRLTNGLTVSEFVGYMFLNNRGTINFYFGFEFIQGFTQNRRDFNFDTMEKDDKKRNDFLNSFKVGWIFPLYKRAPQKYYMY
ncbi:MAG: hypothetical protein KAT68_00390 [Bacteroidales bacterium]|nr:hypothetical protein [Bacteroidales bacterium]